MQDGVTIYFFWATAFVMLIVATVFVVAPLRDRLSALRTRIFPIVIIVSAVTVGIYVAIGSPGLSSADARAPHSGLAAVEDSSRSTTDRSSAPIANLLEGLELRLQEETDDAGGWLLLAQTYRHLGRHEEAQAAYLTAKALGRSDESFEQSLPRAGDVTQETIVESGPAGSGPVIRGRVRIADDIRALVNPDDTVFIFAKESREHRMPVAAIRRSARDLPLEFRLSNAETMLVGTDLADYASLIVTARISKTGMATDSSNGLEAWSESISPMGGANVDLLINGTSNETENNND
jgi:hypothetical protein